MTVGTQSRAVMTVMVMLLASLAPFARTQTLVWEDPVATLDPSDGSTSPYAPDIAVSANVAHVVWDRVPPGGIGSIVYRRSVDQGAVWQVEPDLTTSAVGGHPRIAAGGDLVVAAWVEDVSGQKEVRASRSADEGLTWSTPVALSPQTSVSIIVVGVAVDGDAAAVLWNTRDAGTVTYFAAVSSDGGSTWGAEDLVDAVPEGGNWPGVGDIALNSGSVVVLYHDDSSVLARRSTDSGQTWSAATTLDTSGVVEFSARSLASNGATLLALWGRQGEVYVARSADSGATWGASTHISADLGTSSRENTGGISMAGDVAVATWTTYSSNLFAWAESSDGGQTWTPPAQGPYIGDSGNSTAVAADLPYVVAVAHSNATGGGVFLGRAAFPGPSITISTPAPDEVLPPSTTSVTLTVAITNHPAPGYWAWQLDAPFPDTGAVPAGATPVPTDPDDTVSPFVDSTTYTVYVALVDGTTDQLLDATEYPSSRDSVTFHVGPATIAITAPSGVLDSGTTSTPVVANIAAHPAPGYWVWKLDESFPASGPAGGTVGDTVPIDGLEDGDEHTVYAALVDSSGNLLSPSITDDSDFVVGLPPDAVQVMDTQGGGTTVTVPIEIYNVSTLDVAGVDMIVTYDSAILTPANDGAGNTTAVQTGAAVVPAEWYVDQNVVTPGELIVSMASDFATYLIGAGVLITVDFDIAPAAAAGTVTTIGITGLELNEGAVSASTVSGTFTVLDIVYGDVTGNESVGAFDAAWVLEYVANELIGTTIQLPIETSTPPWASLPLTAAEAREVADVDDSGAPQAEPADITAVDASHILMKRVGRIVLFVAEGGAPPAPSSQPSVLAYGLRGAATSSRPGAQITISLDASAVEELYAGELRLDFDPALLRLTDVTLRGGGDASQRPVLVHRMGEGQVAVAFASARPIESTDSTLDVTFRVTRHIGGPGEGTIRSSHLRLNGVRVDTGFSYPFRVEPYRFALMANYPNPFNPETWIPFELSRDADVTVRIYGLDGSIVRTLDLGYRPIGEYRARGSAAYWDGRNEAGERVASGVYVYELLAGEERAVRRMVISK